MHCDNATTHNAVGSVETFGETADKLQIGDPSSEVESGYFNKTETESVCVLKEFDIHTTPAAGHVGTSK
jgi:hypothetical protein